MNRYVEFTRRVSLEIWLILAIIVVLLLTIGGLVLIDKCMFGPTKYIKLKIESGEGEVTFPVPVVYLMPDEDGSN